MTRSTETDLQAFANTLELASETLDAAPGATLGKTWVSSGSTPGSALPEPGLEVLEELGRGGMGIVLLARQTELAREVAVKRLHEGASGDAARMMLREARVTGQLEHPGVVPVYALRDDASGKPMIVMKRIEGVAWSKMLSDPAHPMWERVEQDPLRWHLQTLVRLCHTIAYAHDRGVLHRDLKPDNVMIGAFSEVILVDWGIAARMDEVSTSSGLIGTPAYMAPEQVAGAAHDARTDVYLLGAILHEIVTGEPRHQGSSVVEVLYSASLSEPVDYGDAIPDELAAICNRATAAEPADRYPSVDALRRALEAFLQHMSSIELTREASAQLAAQPEAGRERLDEIRSGLRQALKLWAENPQARSALDETLSRVAAIELEAGHIDAAARLSAQRSTPDPELEARLERARVTESQRAERMRALEANELDQDITVSSRARGRLALGYGLFNVIIDAILLIAFYKGALSFNWPTLVMLCFVFNAFYWLGVWVFRDRIRWTTLNTRLIQGLGAILVALLPLRLSLWAMGLPPLKGFQVEFLTILLLCGMLALNLDRRLLPSGIITGALFALSLAWPAWTIELYTMSLMVLCFYGAWLWIRQGPPEEAAQSTSNGVEALSQS